jgi:hypothetical protein
MKQFITAFIFGVGLMAPLSIQPNAFADYTYFHPHHYWVPGHYGQWSDNWQWVPGYEVWD